MATPNSFLSTYKGPEKPKQAFGASSPNYAGKIGGALGKLITPDPNKPTVKQQANANPKTQNTFLNNYGTSNKFLQSMGAQAKAPEQDIKPPATTLPTGQVKTTPSKESPTSVSPTPTPPAVAQTSPSQNQNFNPNANFQTPGVMGASPQGTAQTQGNQQAQPNTPSPFQVNGGLYGQLITSLANRSTQPGQPYTDAMGSYQKAVDNLSTFRKNLATAQGNIETTPIPLEFQQGRSQVLAKQAAGQEAALQSAVSEKANVLGAANTQQGLLQQALQQAAAGAAPTQVTPGNYLASPLQGGAMSASEGQQQGFQAARDWNIAQQNILQGRTYQGQAQDISNSLQLLQTIRPQLTSFMNEAGLNPATAPILNQQINKIDAQANPVAYRTMAALVAESRSFVQQMLQAQGGMTPTDAGNLVSTYDFGQLTPAQLSLFLQNMEVAGNLRLSQAQSASQAGYGAATQVGAPAQGQTAQGGTLQIGGANQLNNLPDWLKVLGGFGSGVAGAAGQAVQGVAGNAVAGATGGMAAKVLGL